MGIPCTASWAKYVYVVNSQVQGCNKVKWIFTALFNVCKCTNQHCVNFVLKYNRRNSLPYLAKFKQNCSVEFANDMDINKQIYKYTFFLKPA